MTAPSIVMWRDAFEASDTWVFEGSEPDIPVIVTTVGWIIDMLDGYVVVASSSMVRDGTHIYGGVQYIPAGMVVSIISREGSST